MLDRATPYPLSYGIWCDTKPFCGFGDRYSVH
jgi:hypothetical protein